MKIKKMIALLASFSLCLSVCVTPLQAAAPPPKKNPAPIATPAVPAAPPQAAPVSPSTPAAPAAPANPWSAPSADQPPTVLNAQAAILMDLDTATVLFEKNADTLMFPASTTKIMTALLAIEKLDLQRSLTVPADMGPAEGSAMYLLPGETFTVHQLLQALMVKSANDAAVLLARTISGDTVQFAKLMNERAAALGCKNTHFSNPNGLPDPNHQISARDMALIAREAMKNPVFQKLVSTTFVTLPETPQTPEKRFFRNTNRFLWSESKMILNNQYIPIKYAPVFGVKTGYTDDAKNCLVSAAQKNGSAVLAVVFKASGFEVYRDSRLLLDYGMDFFTHKNLLEKGQILGTEESQDSVEKKIDLVASKNYTALVTRKPSKRFPAPTLSIVKNPVKMPVKPNDVLGAAIIKDAKGQVIERIPLLSSGSLTKLYSKEHLWQLYKDHQTLVWMAMAAILILLALLLFLIAMILRLVKNRRSSRSKIKYF